jgi:Na+-translocating ferredoxin:NAD+ oxidoreductase subunit A
MHDTVFQIFISTLLANNLVLAMFLGLCPFFGISGSLKTAIPMGLAATFVMLIASAFAFGLNILVTYFDLQFLRLISYIVVIASAVQLVEMFIKKFSPTLFRALGIYLPLITTNCAVLAVALFQTSREYNLVQSITFAFAGGAGFTLALALIAGLRERVRLATIPEVAAKGMALPMMIAGFLSLAFMGFAGIGG